MYVLSRWGSECNTTNKLIYERIGYNIDDKQSKNSIILVGPIAYSTF